MNGRLAHAAHDRGTGMTTMSVTFRRPESPPALPPLQVVEERIIERAKSLHAALALVAIKSDRLVEAAEILIESLQDRHLVLACGNGGSAAEAQHLVGELVGRFLREREPWPAIALTTDSSVLTSIANDYGFERVFQRQVAAFGGPGGALVAFTTSGESPNIVHAVREARGRGMRVLAFTGRERSTVSRFADVTLAVPASSTPLVQEVHAVLLHLLCEMVESSLADAATPGGMSQ
jgi:D-sedoheptulose 7-phosphate isomerase